MKINKRKIRFAVTTVLAIWAVSWIDLRVRAADPAPATQPDVKSAESLSADVQKQFGVVQDVLSSPEILTDASKRAAVSADVVPALKKIVIDFDGLSNADPDNKQEAINRKAEFTMFLSLFGDAEATKKLTAMTTSADPAEALNGKRNQLMVTWLSNKDSQPGVVDEIEKLANANPTDSALTMQIYQMKQLSSPAPELAIRLVSLMTDVMKNSVADSIKAQLAAGQKLALLENKPFVIAGKQADGKSFTTADWKGKVILIDFWATWCGPCVGEIPHVAKMYTDFHGKGLEVLGVSNDSSADVLNKFLASNIAVAWQQILDAPSEGSSNFGPLTLGQGIEGIPTMFLIDKKGILRSVSARENMDSLIPQLLDEK